MRVLIMLSFLLETGVKAMGTCRNLESELGFNSLLARKPSGLPAGKILSIVASLSFAHAISSR